MYWGLVKKKKRKSLFPFNSTIKYVALFSPFVKFARTFLFSYIFIVNWRITGGWDIKRATGCAKEPWTTHIIGTDGQLLFNYTETEQAFFSLCRHWHFRLLSRCKRYIPPNESASLSFWAERSTLTRGHAVEKQLSSENIHQI